MQKKKNSSFSYTWKRMSGSSKSRSKCVVNAINMNPLVTSLAIRPRLRNLVSMMSGSCSLFIFLDGTLSWYKLTMGMGTRLFFSHWVIYHTEDCNIYWTFKSYANMLYFHTAPLQQFITFMFLHWNQFITCLMPSLCLVKNVASTTPFIK